jgi:S-adenosylmethionine hydrolase
VHSTGIARIALVTDFGVGIYVGQVRARLSALVPGVPLVDLVHDLAPFRPDLAAYLLPALVRDMPRGTLYLCVVDPGVGGERGGLLLEAAGDWFLGPDNGLLSRVLHRDAEARPFRVGWSPAGTSPSFHGRDWFAPAAARLCLGEPLDLTALERDCPGGR